MFQQGASAETAAESGESPRKPARAQPVVDESLRAGAKLAQARQQRGLSLDEIAERLHVRRDYLEALEAMNVKVLPGRAYALAYMRDYAKLLGLDPVAIVEQFKRESALTREDAQPQLRNPESKPRTERPWLAAAAVALVAAGFLGYQALRDAKGGEDSRLETAGAALAAPNPAAPVAEPAPAPTATAQPVIEVTALQPAWLEVRGPDGTIFLSRDLKPGDRYRPDVGAGWTLHARDGGAFQVSIDGRSAGLLGEAGAPVLGRRVDLMAAGTSVTASARPQG
jgi:transcriptional regulator with XRE-family HTH domain